jgi:tetratricopeptide (TPR) repeat protein
MEKDNEPDQKFDILSFLIQKGKTTNEWSKSLEELVNSERMKAARGNIEDVLRSDKVKTARENIEEVLKSEKVRAATESGMKAVDQGMRKVFGRPTRSDELNFLGNEELRAGRYMSALAYFKDALKKDPENINAINNIEKVLLRIKDMASRTLMSLDHEASKTITEIAVLEDQATSMREHLILIEELVQSKRDYLQELVDKYNKINEETSDKSDDLKWQSN